MVFFNYALRKLNAKIVYYGPGLCGKTSNLQWIHDHFEGGHRGKMISLATEGDRTIFFDLLPLDIGKIRGMEVTLQLYTVPGQVHYNSTRQLVLKSADGVVFVADSQRAMLQSNLESWANLKENLVLQGLELESFPHVLQFNKRDLRDLVTVEEMDEELNEYDSPIFESVATQGIGVQETLEGIVKLVMRSLRERYEAMASPRKKAPGEVPAPTPDLAAPAPIRTGALRPPSAPEQTGPTGPPSQSVAPPEPGPPVAGEDAAHREAITHPTLETTSHGVPAQGPGTLPPVVGDEITAVFGGEEEAEEEAEETSLATTQAIGHLARELSEPAEPPAAGLEPPVPAGPPVQAPPEAAPEPPAPVEPVAAELEPTAPEPMSVAPAAEEIEFDVSDAFEPPEPAAPEPAEAPPEPAAPPHEEIPYNGSAAPGLAAEDAAREEQAVRDGGATDWPPKPEPPDMVLPERAAARGREAIDDLLGWVASSEKVAAPPVKAAPEPPAAEPGPPATFEPPAEPEVAAPEQQPTFEPAPPEPEPPVQHWTELPPPTESPAEPSAEPPSYSIGAPAPPPAEAASGEPIVLGADEPFSLDNEPPITAEASAVVALPHRRRKTDQPFVDVADGSQLQLRLEGTEALAKSGEVRELDIMVPVPGRWIGNRRVTLQLRLTLVPAAEEEP